MLFLDAVYFICCNFYKKREKDAFKINGVILLTLLLGLNVMIVLLLTADSRILEHSTVYTFRYYIVGACLLIPIPLLHFRYFRITNYDKIDEIFNHMTDRRKMLYYILSFLYIALSILTALGYVIYRGGIVSGWWS